MRNHLRCLYENSIAMFLCESNTAILGELCDHNHGVARDTTIDAWNGEIAIMKDVLSQYSNKDGKIIFEYDIPRLGKRIDVVLLYQGIRDQLKRKNNNRALPVLSPLMMPDKQMSFIPKDAEVSRLEDEKDRLIREQREMDSKIMAAFSTMAYENEREKAAKEWKGIAPAHLLDELVNFSVDDPYENAFALLALLDSNSDIPWLYYGSVAVYYTLIDQLPITHSMYLYEGSRKGELRRGTVNPNYRMDYPSEHRFDMIVDADGDAVERERAENIAQKIFARAFTHLPRISREIQDLDQMMKEIGAETDREKAAYELLLQVLWAQLDNENGLLEYMVSTEKEEQPEEATEENLQETTDPKEIAELKRQIAVINREYRAEAAKARDLQNECDELVREAEDMRRELAELRNVVFNRENPEAAEESEAPSVSFPYAVKHRIVSFGGHPSWLKSMKEYLPDVRFISPDMLPNTMLLRMADMIWIQPNCISHSDYFRIMNVAREQQVPVHYYTFDGAAKCAQQLAEEDGK